MTTTYAKTQHDFEEHFVQKRLGMVWIEKSAFVQCFSGHHRDLCCTLALPSFFSWTHWAAKTLLASLNSTSLIILVPLVDLKCLFKPNLRAFKLPMDSLSRFDIKCFQSLCKLSLFLEFSHFSFSFTNQQTAPLPPSSTFLCFVSPCLQLVLRCLVR